MTRKRDRIQENASRYIVKNCPAYQTFYPDTGAEPFSVCDAELPFKKCQNCTDCVIKQIIELCKNKDYFVKRFPNAQFSSGVQNSELAFDILRLFDIEEIK